MSGLQYTLTYIVALVVEQLVEALRYKQEGHEFDLPSLRPGYLLGSKGG